tara:strand:- start:981 stop:1736 length:756 start_codon:yes stop_codon:yes gene_type:complete
MAIKYRTSGINTDGTSVLAATTKKKSKSKKLWTAIGIGALAIGGLSVYGGWGSGNGAGFLGSLKKGWGDLFSSSSAYSDKLPSATKTVAAPISTALSASGKGSTISNLGSLVATAGTGVKGLFSNITSGQAMLGGYAVQALAALFDKTDEDIMAFNEVQHKDNLEYKYALLASQEKAAAQALEAEVGIAEARQAGSDRRDAVVSTYMGHTSPIMGNVEGVSDVTPGYTPKKPKNYSEFHPVGGLLSAGNVA